MLFFLPPFAVRFLLQCPSSDGETSRLKTAGPFHQTASLLTEAIKIGAEGVGGEVLLPEAGGEGIDVHKETIAVTIADHRRAGEVRFWGTIPSTPDDLQRLTQHLAEQYRKLEFVYEAGPCGYAIYRQLNAKDMVCHVVAPSRLLRRPGDRIKNDHCDAVALAPLARAGEFPVLWVPDPVHKAMRDIIRARHVANKDVKQARLRIQIFLLKQDVRYPKKAWTYRHRMWLAPRRFPHPAQQITFQQYLNSLEAALTRRTQVEGQIRELLPTWSPTPVVQALQRLRGVGMIIAATRAAEVGGLTRFDSPKQLMASLGLTLTCPRKLGQGKVSVPPAKRGVRWVGPSQRRLTDIPLHFFQFVAYGRHRIATRPKVGANGEARFVPMTDTLRTALTRLVHEANAKGSPYLFRNCHGQPYRSCRSAFESAVKQVGLENIHFHDLRHTFASRLVMAGVDIRTVQELMGHKTISMTLRYSHLSPDHKRKAMEALERQFSRKSPINFHNTLPGRDTKTMLSA